MAINRIWMLAAVACLGGAWVALSEPVQPEGCPEGGCRVGYRFEDGGIAPEGWEPYVTDDPVVALMDACLTYFMTGDLEMTGGWAAPHSSEGHLYIELPGVEDSLHIFNFPFSEYGTFICDNSFSLDQGEHAAFTEWMAFRFSGAVDWEVMRSSGEPAFSEYWSVSYYNDRLSAGVRLQNFSPLNTVDATGLSFQLRTGYFGPSVRTSPGASNITF